MKIAILGWGTQGQSAYEYWNTSDNHITICDRDTTLTTIPSGCDTQLGETYLEKLDRFDLAIRTPALHPREIINANNSQILDKVWSNTNEFIKVCPTKNIIGITGTKGKGTTSSLIAEMLKAAGLKVHLGGNIGIPPLELLKNNIHPDDWVVLELANFQLIDLKNSPRLGVCLMITEEHTDWHDDFEEYIAAKQQLFINQTENDVAIYYAKNEYSESIAGASPGKLIPYYEKPGAEVINNQIVIDENVICHTDDLALLGKHNWQNICAAITASWQVTKDIDALRQAATTFSGLPFRIEFRREVNGIRYFNDSFATGYGATVAAIESIPGNKVLIIGGYDRMLPLEGLAEAINRNQQGIRKVVLIGASAERTAEALKQQGFNNFVLCEEKTMKGIVTAATSEAKQGDAVVLSPSFASFDMFKNFEERGKAFNEAVESI